MTPLCQGIRMSLPLLRRLSSSWWADRTSARAYRPPMWTRSATVSTSGPPYSDTRMARMGSARALPGEQANGTGHERDCVKANYQHGQGGHRGVAAHPPDIAERLGTPVRRCQAVAEERQCVGQGEDLGDVSQPAWQRCDREERPGEKERHDGDGWEYADVRLGARDLAGDDLGHAVHDHAEKKGCSGEPQDVVSGLVVRTSQR